MNCEKTSALCPSATTSANRGTSTSSFADGIAAPRLVHQRRVARRLAQPQQRLEHLDLRPLIPLFEMRASSDCR